MGINRAILKADARQRLSRYRPNPIVVGLIVFLISWVLSMLAGSVLGMNALVKIFDMTQYADEEAFLKAYEHFLYNYRPSGVAMLLAAALSIMNYMIGVGFAIYSLHVSRGEKADYGNILDGFGIFFRVLWLAILEGIFIFLWSLLLYVPGIVAAYRYRQALFILLDHPEMSALQCITESKEMMRGHKGELFALDLSFIGWMLLQGVFAPLAVWLAPYREITYANYYNALLGPRGTTPGGGPRIYEGQFTDIPDDGNDNQ